LRRDPTAANLSLKSSRRPEFSIRDPGARATSRREVDDVASLADGRSERWTDRVLQTLGKDSSVRALKPEVSIVVPLFNEEACVARLVRSLEAFRATFDRACEVVLVDDGSTDLTAAVVESALPNLPDYRLVRLRSNAGQTAAMAAGLDHARGEIIVFMDGDLQNDPQDIPRLLKKIDEGFDLVSGWRRDRKDRALTRKLPSYVANRLIGIVTGVRLHDYGCTLKAYRARVLRPLKLYSDMHRFLPALSDRAGARICEIVVRHHPRTAGYSKYGLSRVLKVAFDLVVLKMILDFAGRPMHYFGLLSLAFLALAGIAAATWALNLVKNWLEGTIILPAIVVLFFVSFLYFLFLGLLAELIHDAGGGEGSGLARAVAETV
jgi:glycosyltransferase involved in cell wall biosynthesis